VKKKALASGIVLMLVATAVLLSGCINSGSDDDTKGTVSFGLPPWPGVTVKTEVVKQVLEDWGYTVKTSTLDAGIVYAEMAKGNIDVLLAGWLPVTHQDYWTQYGDDLEQVHVNVDTTWLGLAVPSYVYDAGVTAVSDLNDYVSEFGGTIVGIEPGAGIMHNAERAIDLYDLDYTLKSSSTPAMMAEVDSKIKSGEWVVFTIWEPHSAFARFDIQKLDEPEQIFGGGDVVYTITRTEFADDFPELQWFFEKFEVAPDTQSEWILLYSDEGMEPSEIAAQWIAENQDLVESWKS
jgi:glycine betaine/proline transport system substrate-binding protein